MKKLKNIFFPVVISLTLFISCKKDPHTDAGIDPVATGRISGKIVAANNTTPIRSATIFTNNAGQLYITHTDQNGMFVLEAAAGSRHITIQSGDGAMFRTEMDVVIKENETTEIASQPITLNQIASLAYIPGVYDKIESILIDSLGYTATAITWNSLSLLFNITPYDAIFINCTSPSDMPAVTATTDQNLGDYVANGGSLYVSDWAVSYLMGQTVASTQPCTTQKPGGFIADNLLCTRQTGAIETITNASITSLSLQAYLNATTINEIVYNLPSWEKINELDAGFWETMVADQTGNPLLIRTNLYSNPTRGTFHVGGIANSDNALICVQDNNGQNITLSVKSTDAPALVAAGATMGACDNVNDAGRIYYTTFHNEPNGQIAPDVKNILSYVILNL
ncbi:MAG: hypothetical protein ABI402_10525 [Ferruginibacter sp.]